jgi:hypothetical protein
LWEYIKAAVFDSLKENNRNPEELLPKPVIPVFIFDQFEEFFNHPVSHQKEFLRQLAEVVHDETPLRILEWITSINPDERKDVQIEWHQQPIIKVVFALRSDKLALMQSLTEFIPTILRNRYELKPLTKIQAREAIEEPARRQLQDHYTRAFNYEPVCLQKIVDELSRGTDEIESSQLQIVCNFIENRIRKVIKENPDINPLVVNNSIIVPNKDFPMILDNFYEAQLELIADENNREKARLLIENELVIEGQRDSISEKKLLKSYGISKDLIGKLLNTRLIREENTSRGPIYELSHDTLIETVEKSRDIRRKKEELALAENERRRLEEEAKRKDAELKEKYRQLVNEMQLREDAEAQRNQVQILAKKIKRKERLIFFLVIFSLLIGIYFLKMYAQKKIRNKQVQVEKNKYKYDSLTIESVKVNDSLKYNFLRVLNHIDSMSNYSINSDTAIKKIIDTVFSADIKGDSGLKRKSPQEKLEILRRRYKIKYDSSKKWIQELKNVNNKVTDKALEIPKAH